MAKTERRSIRIGGKTINSPRFTGKDAKRRADEWYSQKAKDKEFVESGLLSSDSPTFLQYSKQWFLKRQKKNPKSTWAADETRLRKYLLPELSSFPMNRITRTQMRSVLIKVQEENKLSISTRNLIKALASAIFTSALNEKQPLVHFNPCSSLKFDDARRGKKRPATLSDGDEVRAFLNCAKSVGKQEALICAIAVMAGLRKSEIIPLKYSNITGGKIVIDHHVEQASLSIRPGTKSGSEEIREVPIPSSLVEMIFRYRIQSQFGADGDFIICDEKGDWIRPRKLHAMIDAVVKAFGRPITLHKLRHSYGRIFISRAGNQQALKDLLGHKSVTTTMIYSELSGNQLRPFGDMMDFETIETVSNPAELPPKRHQPKRKGGEN